MRSIPKPWLHQNSSLAQVFTSRQFLLCQDREALQPAALLFIQALRSRTGIPHGDHSRLDPVPPNRR
jgi:hypothetical protein